MSWILDVFLILLYIFVIIVCAYRGFVKSVWSTVTVIGALILAYIFGPSLSEWVYDAFVYDCVSSYTYETVESIIEEKSDGYDVSDLLETAPDEFLNLLEHCGADLEEIKSTLSSSVTVSKDELYELAGTIALPVSGTISNLIGFVSIFLGAVIIISLLGFVLRLIVKVPIIRSINSLLGAVLGVAEGFIIVWIVCLIIGLLVENGFMNTEYSETLHLIANDSRLLKFFCELSPIDFINIRIE